jgi:hypothetical protein
MYRSRGTCCLNAAPSRLPESCCHNCDSVSVRLCRNEVSPLREQRLKLKLLTRLSTHAAHRCPANQPGFAPQGRKIHDTRKSAIARTEGAWRECFAA